MEAGELSGNNDLAATRQAVQPPRGKVDLDPDTVMFYYGVMKFAHKPLASGSVWTKPGLPDYRIRVRFSILPRRLRISTGGSVWVIGEQYCVIERLGSYIDWNGMPFKMWSHVANATMVELEGFQQVG